MPAAADDEQGPAASGGLLAGSWRAPSSAHGLLLYLRVEPASPVAIELPVDATVADLRAAAVAAGGPEAGEQVLVVGAEELLDDESTPLSDTSLVTSEAVVCVRARPRIRTVVSCGADRVVVLLADGSVAEVAAGAADTARRRFDSRVTSVHAGFRVAAVVAGGRVELWGSGAEAIRQDLVKLQDRVVMAASLSADMPHVLAAVDSLGYLHMCGELKPPVPDSLQGRIAAAAVGAGFVVALTREGSVVVLCGRSPDVDVPDIGGRTAVSVSAGATHFAVVLDDGSVRCFGANLHGECDPPADLRRVASCSCGRSLTAAVLEDGTVRWWGMRASELRTDRRRRLGRFVSVAAGAGHGVAVTAGGRLVHDVTAAGAAALRSSGVTFGYGRRGLSLTEATDALVEAVARSSCAVALPTTAKQTS
eukprot:TRINITY_DN8031_c0_g2_i1.p1 TRINITY_DN8031_c0_g2~~TRINITY_DN8031_c0_g2_i1.p1  ORF type:complete len:421 (+),score=130.31 TRINITY_DN8031_c0_g2_i1:52-1314(+)